MSDIRVLVVDDQKVVRDGLALLLGLLDGIEVVGTAGDGAAALDLVASLDPDIVLMDLHMPGVDGVEATRRLTAQGCRARVVVLTTWSDDASVFGALQAGARGFLTKDAGAEEISTAIRTVAAGEAQLDPSVQRRLLESLASGRVSTAVETPADGLTAREDEVLREIAQGRSNGEIAAALFVSEATVKTHVNHLLAKTGCRDRAALVAYAFRTGRA
ncbi:MAG: response regulator [Jatrophihabitans sp.]|uniref:response regulator n=1 Tax=Jatrophihabitans sp. TaxID=1932789 RepID=UPI003F81A28C